MYSILIMIFKMIISSNQMRRAVDGCCCDLSGEFSFDLKSMKHWNHFIRKIEIHILMWWDCQHQCSNFPRDGVHHKWNGGVIELSGQFPFFLWYHLFRFGCLNWVVYILMSLRNRKWITLVKNQHWSSSLLHILFLFLSFILHHQL